MVEEYYNIELKLDREVIVNILNTCLRSESYKKLERAVDKLYDQMFDDDNLNGTEAFLNQLTNEQLIEFLKLIKY